MWSKSEGWNQTEWNFCEVFLCNREKLIHKYNGDGKMFESGYVYNGFKFKKMRDGLNFLVSETCHENFGNISMLKWLTFISNMKVMLKY